MAKVFNSRKGPNMTLSDLEKMEDPCISIEMAAAFMGKTPQCIRDQADENPAMLGFPISKICHRYVIPRLGFIHWFKYGNSPVMIKDKG